MLFGWYHPNQLLVLFIVGGHTGAFQLLEALKEATAPATGQMIRLGIQPDQQKSTRSPTHRIHVCYIW